MMRPTPLLLVTAALLALACCTRMALLLAAPPSFPEGWGGEMSSVALAISEGRGFADPYWFESGPTAQVPPVFPFLLATVFYAFGGHTVLAGWVGFVLVAGLSALIVVPLVGIGEATRRRDVGVLAAFLWALYPVTGLSDARFLWSTSLFALLLTTMLWWTLELGSGWRERVAYGLFIGLAVLTEPVGVVVAFWVLAWLLGVRRIGLTAVAAIAVAGAVLPGAWAARNAVQLGAPMLRSNFGLELYRSVTFDDLGGVDQPMRLPNRNEEERAEFERVGELAYMGQKGDAAVEWIRDHPREWATLVARRYLAFWHGDAFIELRYWLPGHLRLLKSLAFLLPALLAGVGLFFLERRHAVLFGAILLTYPLPYTLALTLPRYRLPLEPLIVLCAAAGLLALARGQLRRGRHLVTVQHVPVEDEARFVQPE